MSRCLSMVSTAVVSIVCMCVVGGCAVQGNEQDDPSAGEPATQDLTTPQLLTFSQAFTTDQFGNIRLTGVLDIRDNKEVDLEIIQFPVNAPNMTVEVRMGVFSAVNSLVGSFALGTAATIHTFNVRGPEVVVNILGGPPNTAVNIQGWLFLH
jgi:hypothetical protein